VLNSILIDAGPLIALFDSSDRHHKGIKSFLKENPYRYISTVAVFTEVSHMLDFSVHAQRDFYEWIMCKGVFISDINQNDMPRIVRLTEQYADLPMDFADATLVVTAEKTGIQEIISLDRDFDVYRLPGKERIHNVYRLSSISSPLNLRDSKSPPYHHRAG
jgi:predicted nucleic acid-binding protein